MRARASGKCVGAKQSITNVDCFGSLDPTQPRNDVEVKIVYNPNLDHHHRLNGRENYPTSIATH